MRPEADLIFVAVMIVAIIAAVIFTWGKGKAWFEACLRQIEQHGYAVDYPREKNRGTITRVWGRYGTPVPLYLHFSNRDPVSTVAGRLGIADFKVGHAAFDAAFFVRSNKPEWARQFLTAGLCERLVGFENIQFCTSAIGRLLTPDYWPEEKDRNRRDLWMLRVDGKLEGAALAPYVALARELSSAVQAFCVSRVFETGDVVAGYLEGK